jgi:hypothetical protein
MNWARLLKNESNRKLIRIPYNKGLENESYTLENMPNDYVEPIIKYVFQYPEQSMSRQELDYEIKKKIFHITWQ